MNENTASDEEYMGQVVRRSYPTPEDISAIPTAFRRRWVLRLGKKVPSGEALESALKTFERSVRRTIADALGIPDGLEHPVPAASAVRIDDHHLVIAIDCPGPASQEDMGDAAAIATFGILRAADQQWHLEDLQGIPKRYWYWLG
jgi:hypothetical protein